MSKKCFLFLLLIFNVIYSMEQDKPAWSYYNDINQTVEDFHLDAGNLGYNSLVPDDINDPTRWVADPNNDEQLPYDLPKIFTDVIKIRKKFTYNPPHIDSSQPITWLVLHGTFGQETVDYFDDGDVKRQNFRHIKRAASAYATRKAKNLELLSFKWASKWRSKFYGGLSDTDRVKGAKVLHNFLKYMKYDENNELVILSHSHGCNLVNALTHLIKPERPIELLIHFACPRRKQKEDHYQPTNYKKLIYFFSDGDIITVLGRVPEVEIGGTLKNVTKALALPTHHNLDQEAASVKDIRSYFKEMTNEFKPSLCKDNRQKVRNLNALGLHTRINGTDPGHSPIVDAVKHLTTIMETLSKNYPEHVNTIFDLEIDDTKKPPMIIAVKKEYEAMVAQEADEESLNLRLSKTARIMRTARRYAATGGYVLGGAGAALGMAVSGSLTAVTAGAFYGLVGMLGGSLNGIYNEAVGIAQGEEYPNNDIFFPQALEKVKSALVKAETPQTKEKLQKELDILTKMYDIHKENKAREERLWKAALYSSENKEEPSFTDVSFDDELYGLKLSDMSQD